MKKTISLDDILGLPEWFLGGINYPNRVLTYFKTSQALLSVAPFHDGRTSLHNSSDVLEVSLDDALDWHSEQASGDYLNRIIAHTSFCGSTLLARAVENRGHVMTYREPHIFAQLANIKTSNPDGIAQSPEWSSLLKFVFSQFQIPWTNEEITIVKPSNWANPILVDLAETETQLRAVILSMSLKSYLVANIRGGKSRLGFSINLLNHLVRGRPQYNEYITRIQALKLSPMQQALSYLTICHEIQHVILHEFCTKRVDTNILHLDKTNLIENQEQALLQVARSLSFKISKDGLKNAVTTFDTNSKSTAAKTYNQKEELSLNKKIQMDYQFEIERACEWHSKAFKGRRPEF